MIDALLVLNAGSSSLKFQAFREDTLEILAAGKVTGIGTSPHMKATAVESGESLSAPLEADHPVAALQAVLDFIDRHDDGWNLHAVVHRIVHGGTRFTGPVIVTPAIAAELARLSELAPLHQPHNLAGLSASERLAPGAVNIACFDTAFHAAHDALVYSFALPAEVREMGVRRYGFHGLSYAWVAHFLAQTRPDLARGRVVAAHLGNGASLCAIHAGRSIDTTMGMTALDGLPMGTRSGAIDPGAITWIMRELGLSPEAMDDMLYAKSGLLGLSGISNDVAELLASDDPDARFALSCFAAKVAQFAAMMAVSMGGIDAIVFTGGIGENAASIRADVMQRIAFLGPVEQLVVAANEERIMAIEAKALLA